LILSKVSCPAGATVRTGLWPRPGISLREEGILLHACVPGADSSSARRGLVSKWLPTCVFPSPFFGSVNPKEAAIGPVSTAVAGQETGSLEDFFVLTV